MDTSPPRQITQIKCPSHLFTMQLIKRTRCTMWKSDWISWCNRLQRTRPLREAPMTSNKRKHSSQDPRHTISDKESSPRLTQRKELSPLRRRVRTKYKVFFLLLKERKGEWKINERIKRKAEKKRGRIRSGYFSFDGNTREGVILKRYSRFFLEWTILFSEIYFTFFLWEEQLMKDYKKSGERENHPRVSIHI